MLVIHATSVAIGRSGLLVRGPSGSGKSDLALRLIDAGACLVSDDQTVLEFVDGQVEMKAPPAIAGFIEVRGVGIMPVPTVTSVPLALVVDLVSPETVERLPEPDFCIVLGSRFPLLRLAPFEASAPAKLRLALAALAVPATLRRGIAS